MYVRRIVIADICGIRALDLQLTRGKRGPHTTLFIGKNGTGKSTVLRSIVLGLASNDDAAALLAEPFGSPFVSAGQDKGSIKLELVDQRGRTHSLTKQIRKQGNNDERVESSPAPDLQQSPLVVGFGAGRSNEGAESSSGGSDSLVDSSYMLFNYEGTFIQPELTLRRLEDYVGTKAYSRVLNRIRRALGLRRTDVLQFEKGGGVLVSGPYKEKGIPLHAWADGYRVTLNWLLDIYAWAMRRTGAIDSGGHVHGVLLVDEIEQHLHPSMQRHIVQSVKKLFPKMQLLASTHSPLVLQGVESHEIVSLHRRGSRVTAKQLHDYAGSSVEDLLTAEELFRTPPYSAKVEQARKEYRKLVGKRELSSAEREKLGLLGKELARLTILSPLPHHQSRKP